jgi:hypothetical protein
MLPIPEWAGRVQFFELLFGTWIFYIFLVFLFQVVLRTRLTEWRYALLTFFGASFYWINHYYQEAPFYRTILYAYTFVFLAVWYFVGIKQMQAKTWVKLVVGLVTMVVSTIAFIMFEHIAQWGCEGKLIPGQCMNEYVFMLISYVGYIFLIVWRGRVNEKATQKLELAK